MKAPEGGYREKQSSSSDSCHCHFDLGRACAGRVKAVDTDSAVASGHETCNYPHGRSFTCPIGPQEPKDFALLHFKGHPLDCYFCRITFREVFNGNQRRSPIKLF